MHTTLLKEASDSVLRSFLYNAFEELKHKDEEMYEELELELYKELYGCHFSKSLLERAVNGMINEDGTTGPHWTVDQTNSVAKSIGVSFNKYNEYDWNYTMNMIYSDYYGIISNDANTYASFAIKFLNDKDAPEGKALHYYLAMKK